MAGDYSLPVKNDLMKLFEKYTINADDIIKKSKEKEISSPTQSRLKGFMEYRKVFDKGSKPYSFINGFSINDVKIRPGKDLLTEIAGDIFAEKSKCVNASSIFLKNVSFMNDEEQVVFYDFDKIKQDSGHNRNNYYYVELNESNNLEVYINTNTIIDEYSFEAVCFESPTSDLLESLNELEISLNRQKEKSFNLTVDANDPTDLSNVIMLDGQVGYNQSKKFKSLVPTSFTSIKSTGKTIVEVLYQGEAFRIEEGDIIAEGQVLKIYKDYFLFEKNGKIDTLKISKTITRN